MARMTVRRFLLWIVMVIIVLIALSVLFGGFQKGPKAGISQRMQPNTAQYSFPALS